jgi:hypothetical protein
LRSKSVVVHSLNVYKCRVLSCFVFLPSVIPLLVFLPSFAPPPSHTRLPTRSLWLFQTKGRTFGLLLLLFMVFPFGDQIADMGHVLNAVPGQWLVVTPQFGMRTFFDKSQGQYQSPPQTVPNGGPKFSMSRSLQSSIFGHVRLLDNVGQVFLQQFDPGIIILHGHGHHESRHVVQGPGNPLQGSCEIRFSRKGQDVVLNTNVIG